MPVLWLGHGAAVWSPWGAVLKLWCVLDSLWLSSLISSGHLHHESVSPRDAGVVSCGILSQLGSKCWGYITQPDSWEHSKDHSGHNWRNQ